MNATLEGYRRQVAELLTSLGLEASEGRLETDEDGSSECLWVMRHGSAVIFVRLLGDPEADRGWFRLSAPLVFLPEKNLLPFYRRLLELNAELPGVSLAVSGPVVELVAERPLEGMDRAEAESLLQRVAVCADKLDDKLFQAFGAPHWRPH